MNADNDNPVSESQGNGTEGGFKEFIITNETPRHIAFEYRDSRKCRLVLPPFGKHTVTPKDMKDLDLDGWRSTNFIRVIPVTDKNKENTSSNLLIVEITIAFWGSLIWVGWELFGNPPQRYFSTLCWILFVVLVVGLCHWMWRAWKQKRPDVFRALLSHYGSLLVVFFVAYGLPGLVIFTLGDVAEFDESVGIDTNNLQTQQTTAELKSESSVPNVIKSPVSNDSILQKFVKRVGKLWPRSRALETPSRIRLKRNIHTLGRGLQFLFIGTFAFLPALLFYLFDRQRLSTVREEFFRSVLVLDPNLRTLGDARSVYGTRVDEILGEEPDSQIASELLKDRGQVKHWREGSGRLQRYKRLMVLVATLIVTICWILCLSPVVKVAQHDYLPSYFIPAPSPIVFAFLGAYVFSIGLLLRLYLRSDLKPKAYAQICVRIITAVSLSWAISTLPSFTRLSAPESDIATQVQAATIGLDKQPPSSESTESTPEVHQASSETGSDVNDRENPRLSVAVDPRDVWQKVGAGGYMLLLLAFMIGFFPTVGFAVIHEFFRNKKWLCRQIPSLEERLPLNLLDGVNIYHRARLLHEGIENLENLAHSDLVDLMLQTRFPLPTLVDWMDQSILHLHVRSQRKESDGVEDQKESIDKSLFVPEMQNLRSYGIRTATDLKRAYKKSEERNECADFFGILDTDTDLSKTPPRLRVILDTIEDDEWMPHLEHYRKTDRFNLTVWSFEAFTEEMTKAEPKKGEQI
jgi:hypothetical protein